MAKIKNTAARNMYGDGYEQEITLDNGEQYIIRNTPAKNMFGNGYEKEIVKKNDSTSGWGDIVGDLILGAGGLILMGILWLIFSLM